MTNHSGRLQGRPQRRAQAVDITCRRGRCNDSHPGLADDVPQHDDFFDHNFFARPRETGPPSGNDILPRTPTQAPVVSAPISILAPVVGSPTTASPMTASPPVVSASMTPLFSSPMTSSVASGRQPTVSSSSTTASPTTIIPVMMTSPTTSQAKPTPLPKAGTEDSTATPSNMISLSPVANVPSESPSNAAPSENAIKESTGMGSMPLCDVVDGVFGETAFAAEEVFPYVYQVETTPNTIIDQKLLSVIKAMTNQAIVQKIFLDSCSPVGSISIWNRRSIVESIGERRLIRAVGLTSEMKDKLLKYEKCEPTSYNSTWNRCFVMSGAVTLYLREIEFSEAEKNATSIQIKDAFNAIKNLETEIINIEYLRAGLPNQSDFGRERYYSFVFVGGFTATLFLVWAAWDCTSGRKNREKERCKAQISEHTRSRESSPCAQTPKELDLRPDWQKNLSQEQVVVQRTPSSQNEFDWYKHLRESDFY